MALPQLTEEQRAAALEKAAAARRARAELKDRLKRGGTTLGEVLKQSDTDEVLGKMKVSALLEAMPGRRQGPCRADHGAAGDRAVAAGCAGSATGSARRCWPTSSPETGESRATMPGGVRRGRLVVLAGPSGVGKSSVVDELRGTLPGAVLQRLGHHPRPAARRGRRRATTTSSARPASTALIERGELLEWAEIHGGLQRSGTPREPVERALAAGRPVLVEVDLQGARAIKAALPEAVTVFLAPPSLDELARRLRGRGTESEAQFAAPAADRPRGARRPRRVRRGRGQRRPAGRRRAVGRLAGRPRRPSGRPAVRPSPQESSS